MNSFYELLENFTLLTQWGKMSPDTAEHLITVAITPLSVILTAIFNNRKMTDTVRILISLAVAFALAVIQMLAMGRHFGDLLEALSIIIPLQVVIYKGFALKLGIRDLENMSSREEHRDSDIDKPLPTSSTIDAIDTLKEVGEARDNARD